jgi:hypothetical protein
MSERSSVHGIRLNGPWEVDLEAAGDSPGRVTLPGSLHDIGLAGYSGRVRFRRRFGRPTGITTESVHLAFRGVRGPAAIVLNGQTLGMVHSPRDFDVTGQLLERNELEVVVVAGDDQCGIVGDVVLEIRSAVDGALEGLDRLG